MEKFNYEEKIWGANKVRATPFYLGALRIKYALLGLSLIRKAAPGKIKLLEVGCGGDGKGSRTGRGQEGRKES